LYLIIRGRARVEVRRDDGDVKVVAHLADGDFMGEMALLTGEPRTATVVAETEVECWRLDVPGFRDALTKRPEIANELSRILAERKVGLLHAKEGPSATRTLAGEQSEFLSKITKFFGL